MSSELQPPYGSIARALRKGRVVPFLGAGVSRSVAQTPGGGNAEGLPSGAQLSRALAKLVNFPAEHEHELDDLARVASYYVETDGRRSLRELLHETFNHDYVPGRIHEYLAGIERPLLIVTTNYDDLTERAFMAKGRPYDLVVHPTDRPDMAGAVLWWKHGEKEPTAETPNRLPMTDRLRTTAVIYKMHGTIVRSWYRGETPPDEEDEQPYRDDSYVITEEDYIDFLHRMTQQAAVPMQFMSYFSTRQFLFLGYGLRDWNLRVVLKNLNAVLKLQAENNRMDENEDRSWAIQYNPSLLERRLWERRNVDIYNLDINVFVDELIKR
jgi:NAD-dependent SIR2 family protein deacetylase